MRRLLVLAAVLVLPLTTLGKVWTTVYRCDEATPLEAIDPNQPTVYRDIMVGTKLVIVVSSDEPGKRYDPDFDGGAYLLWSGSLEIWHDGQNEGQGVLSARGYNQKSQNYDGSCLPAAGAWSRTKVWYYDWGYSLRLDFIVDPTCVPGDWFVFDYYAGQVGVCDIEFWDVFASLMGPVTTLTFHHVPSRDFNGDAMVDFQDLALLASHWGQASPADPNNPATACDLNSDGRIDFADLALFGEYWRERTDCSRPAGDPNSPPSGL